MNCFTRKQDTFVCKHCFGPVKAVNLKLVISNQMFSIVDMECPECRERIGSCRPMTAGEVSG